MAKAKPPEVDKDAETAMVDGGAGVRPLDGGWGWMVMLGMSIQMFLSIGMNRSFTLLYVDMVDRFRMSDTLTSLTIAIQMVSHFLFSFIGGSLSNRFHERSIVLIGCVLSFAAFFITAFAKSIYVLYISFGIMNESYSRCALSASNRHPLGPN